MRRALLLASGLMGVGAVMAAAPAWAQVQCSVQSLAQVLAQLSDTTPPASITPRTMRNLACSTYSGIHAVGAGLTLTTDGTLEVGGGGGGGPWVLANGGTLTGGTLIGPTTLATGHEWLLPNVVFTPGTLALTPMVNTHVGLLSGTQGNGGLVRAKGQNVHLDQIDADAVVQNNASIMTGWKWMWNLQDITGGRQMGNMEMKQLGTISPDGLRNPSFAMMTQWAEFGGNAGGTWDGHALKPLGIVFGADSKITFDDSTNPLGGASLWNAVVLTGEQDIGLAPSGNTLTVTGTGTAGDTIGVDITSSTNPGFGTISFAATVQSDLNLPLATQTLGAAVLHNSVMLANDIGIGPYGAGDLLFPQTLKLSWPAYNIAGPVDITVTPHVTGAGTEVLTLGTPVTGASIRSRIGGTFIILKLNGVKGYAGDTVWGFGSQSNGGGYTSGGWQHIWTLGGQGSNPDSDPDATGVDIEPSKWPFQAGAVLIFAVPETNFSGAPDTVFPNMSLGALADLSNVNFTGVNGGPLVFPGAEWYGDGSIQVGSGTLKRLVGNASVAGIELAANGWEGTAISVNNGGGASGPTDLTNRYYVGDTCGNTTTGQQTISVIGALGQVVTPTIATDSAGHAVWPSAPAGSVPAANQPVAGCSGTNYVTHVTWTAANTLKLTGTNIWLNGTLTGGSVVAQSGTLTASTTGISLANRFGEVINVMDYGALGDDSHDDTSNINAAFTAARAWIAAGVTIGQSTTGVQVLVPPPSKAYKTTGPVNATGLVAYPNTAPVDISGYGAYVDCQVAGKTCFDLLGDTGITVRGLEIRGVGAGGTPPTTGFQIGRVTTASADRNAITDVSSIGTFSIAACYVEGSEITELRHPRCYNSGTLTAHALYLDASNHANITSDFVTVTNPIDSNGPFNDLLVTEGDLRNGGNAGSAVIMTGEMFRPRLFNTYVLNQGTNVAEVELFASPLAMYDVQLDIHAEAGTGTIAEEVLIDGTIATPTIHGFHLNEQTTFATTSILALGGSVTNVTLQNPDIEVDSVITSAVPLFDTAANYTLVGGRVWLPAPVNWNAPVSNSASIATAGVAAAGQGSTWTFGGGNNAATGVNSGILWGNGNTASQSTAAAGGNQALADGPFSLALGTTTKTQARQGVMCWSSNGNNQNAQTCMATAHQTGAAAMVLTGNASAANTSNSFNNTVNNTTQSYPIKITCRDVTAPGSDVTALWNTVMLSRDTGLGSAVLTATSTTTPDKSLTRGTAGFTWLLAADTTNAAVTITATPPNAHTWDCAATLGPSTEVF